MNPASTAAEKVQPNGGGDVATPQQDRRRTETEIVVEPAPTGRHNFMKSPPSLLDYVSVVGTGSF